jgi:hypothetical protein
MGQQEECKRHRGGAMGPGIASAQGRGTGHCRHAKVDMLAFKAEFMVIDQKCGTTGAWQGAVVLAGGKPRVLAGCAA